MRAISVADFSTEPDGSAAYREGRTTWRVAPPPGPPVPLERLDRALETGDLEAQREWLQCLRAAFGRAAEARLVRMLEAGDPIWIRTEAARLLARGRTRRSHVALQRTLATARGAGDFETAARCAASLHLRGDPAAARELLDSLDDPAALVSLELRLGDLVPPAWWPAPLVERVFTSSAQAPRAAATRILVRRGDPRGLLACSRALRGGVAERSGAVFALSLSKDRRRRAALLRTALRRETSPRLLIEIALALGADLPAAERIRIVERATCFRNPMWRHAAATHLWRSIPPRARLALAARWLSRERDPRVRAVLEDDSLEGR